MFTKFTMFTVSRLPASPAASIASDGRCVLLERMQEFFGLARRLRAYALGLAQLRCLSFVDLPEPTGRISGQLDKLATD